MANADIRVWLYSDKLTSYMEHSTNPDQSVDRTACGINLAEKRVYMTKPNTLYTAFQIFRCERCEKKFGR